MVKNYTVPVLILFLLVAVGVLGYSYYRTKTIAPDLPVYSETSLVSPSTLTIGEVTYQIEVADTDKKRNQGLSGRVTMPNTAGMLFIFPDKFAYSFWMKDMHFALDFLWIDGDTIVDLNQNVPAPKGEEQPIVITPHQAADKVLEINAGEIAKHGFAVGQKVIIQ